MISHNIFRLGDTQTVSFTTTSASSTAVPTGYNVVRVMSDKGCHLAFGSDPTATTSNVPLPANTVEYFVVAPGEKVGVVRTATSGTLYVTPVS